MCKHDHADAQRMENATPLRHSFSHERLKILSCLETVLYIPFRQLDNFTIFLCHCAGEQLRVISAYRSLEPNVKEVGPIGIRNRIIIWSVCCKYASAVVGQWMLGGTTLAHIPHTLDARRSGVHLKCIKSGIPVCPHLVKGIRLHKIPDDS